MASPWYFNKDLQVKWKKKKSIENWVLFATSIFKQLKRRALKPYRFHHKSPAAAL